MPEPSIILRMRFAELTPNLIQFTVISLKNHICFAFYRRFCMQGFAFKTVIFAAAIILTVMVASKGMAAECMACHQPDNSSVSQDVSTDDASADVQTEIQ